MNNAEEHNSPDGGGGLITLKELMLKHDDGLDYGPISLSLKPGQGALVTVRDLGLMRRLMKCCHGFIEPDFGQVAWWMERPAAACDWERYDFQRQIGYVDRQSQLLTFVSLMENIALYYSYLRDSEGEGKAKEALNRFNLGGYAALRSEILPEPVRRLGLYAQVFCQDPKLLLLERPRQFLDQDFEMVWTMVLNRAAYEGLAYIVFDRNTDIYDSGHFDFFHSFQPNRRSSEGDNS